MTLDPRDPEEVAEEPTERLADNLRIGVDTMPYGKIRAQSRGDISRALTFDQSDYDHATAAASLALIVLGAAFVRVAKVSGGANRQGNPSSDWAVYVRP